jgi:hypothetical protein
MSSYLPTVCAIVADNRQYSQDGDAAYCARRRWLWGRDASRGGLDRDPEFQTILA